jgi:hypothetical protein
MQFRNSVGSNAVPNTAIAFGVMAEKVEDFLEQANPRMRVQSSVPSELTKNTAKRGGDIWMLQIHRFLNLILSFRSVRRFVGIANIERVTSSRDEARTVQKSLMQPGRGNRLHNSEPMILLIAKNGSVNHKMRASSCQENRVLILFSRHAIDSF